jgi:hypothetical protein
VDRTTHHRCERARGRRPRLSRSAELALGRLLAVPAGQRGQSTVEYALVLLGAAAVALALVAWVAGSDVVGRLFDAVVGRILDRAG